MCAVFKVAGDVTIGLPLLRPSFANSFACTSKSTSVSPAAAKLFPPEVPTLFTRMRNCKSSLSHWI